MDRSRFVLTDRQWQLIEPLCPGGAHAPGRTGRDTRLFLEAVLWIVRTNAPWRDLPSEFGNWSSSVKQTIRGIVCSAEQRLKGSAAGSKPMYSNGYLTP